LAAFAVNVGTKCGGGCWYFSTGSLLRMHPSFKQAGESPFGFGCAIVDPDTPQRVGRDAKRSGARGLVQLCTFTDAWAPEVQQQHKDRVRVGLSLTAPPDKTAVIRAVEPNASTIPERMAAMEQAHRLGLRTYAMFCPLLPGIADDPASVQQQVEFGLSCGVEEIFVEPVNGRGPGLISTEAALREAGFHTQADAVAEIRHRQGWSTYVTRLLNNLQQALRKFNALEKLRFLLYPTRLTQGDQNWIRTHGQGVKWLGNDRVPATTENRQIDASQSPFFTAGGDATPAVTARPGCQP
jgi:hypothetical protein